MGAESDTDIHDRVHLHTDLLHPARINAPCAHNRRDGQQCHDATDGASTDGDSCGVLRWWSPPDHRLHPPGGTLSSLHIVYVELLFNPYIIIQSVIIMVVLICGKVYVPLHQ